MEVEEAIGWERPRWTRRERGTRIGRMSVRRKSQGRRGGGGSMRVKTNKKIRGLKRDGQILAGHREASGGGGQVTGMR